jgi:hypothetical protein
MIMPDATLLNAKDLKLHALSEADVHSVLRQHNPTAPAGNVRVMAKLIAAVSDVFSELSDAKRRELAKAKGPLRDALIQVTNSGRTGQRAVAARPSRKVEISQGSGLGDRLGLDEGRARLDRYAVATPLESWAGPVAGAGEIEARLGIPRSTLSHWQQRKVVVGLLRGERKLAYPLDQFVDARPLEGIGDVLKLAPDARSAWLWLRQPHGALDDRIPLDELRAGERDRVTQIAARDFV